MEKKLQEVLPLSLTQQNQQEIKQSQISTQTDPSDKNIVAALDSKKLFDCSQLDLVDMVAVSVAKAFADTGRRGDVSLNEQIEYIIQTLPGHVKRLFPSMRINEIPIAISRGIYKEFGEYYGINVAEIVRFCRAHYESIERVNAAKQILKPIEHPKNTPSKESQFYTFRNNLLTAFDKNKAGNSIEVNGPSLYDFCNKLKLIIFSNQEKYDILNQAAHAVIKDQHNILFVTVEDYKRKPYKRIIELLTESLENNKPLPEDVKILLIMKSKFLTLKSFFADIESSELSLSELVDNKKDLFINES